MTRNNARKKAARTLAEEQGISYADALRRIETQHDTAEMDSGGVSVLVDEQKRAGFLLKQDAAPPTLALHAFCPCGEEECLGIVLPFEADFSAGLLRTFEPDPFAIPFTTTRSGVELSRQGADQLAAVTARELDEDSPGTVGGSEVWARLYANEAFVAWRDENPTEAEALGRAPSPTSGVQRVQELQDHVAATLDIIDLGSGRREAHEEADGSVLCIVRDRELAPTIFALKQTGWRIEEADWVDMPLSEGTVRGRDTTLIRATPTRVVSLERLTLDAFIADLPVDERGWSPLDPSTAAVFAAAVNRFNAEADRFVSVDILGGSGTLTVTVPQPGKRWEAQVVGMWGPSSDNSYLRWALNRENVGGVHLEMDPEAAGSMVGRFRIGNNRIDVEGYLTEPRACGAAAESWLHHCSGLDFPVDASVRFEIIDPDRAARLVQRPINAAELPNWEYPVMTKWSLHS